METNKNFFHAIKDYVKASYDELVNHVVWPTWAEAQKLTVVVASFSLLFSLFLFIVDYIFREILGLYYKTIK